MEENTRLTRIMQGVIFAGIIQLLFKHYAIGTLLTILPLCVLAIERIMLKTLLDITPWLPLSEVLRLYPRFDRVPNLMVLSLEATHEYFKGMPPEMCFMQSIAGGMGFHQIYFDRLEPEKLEKYYEKFKSSVGDRGNARNKDISVPCTEAFLNASVEALDIRFYDAAERVFRKKANSYQTPPPKPVKEIKQKLGAHEKNQLKKMFRDAAKICHPDKVPPYLKTKAEAMFKRLSVANDKEDIKTVKIILSECIAMRRNEEI